MHPSVLRLAALTALALALLAPLPALGADPPPPGANDWSCRPNAAHPNPVVLVHGLGATMGENWSYMSPLLAGEGYCVFALTYGRRAGAPPGFDARGGLVPMEESAQELAAFVQRVLAATGARRVDVVGHSEGSLMPNWWVKFLGGAAKVDRYVGLTPLWDGTNLAGLGTLDSTGRPFGLSQPAESLADAFCGSCRQFLTGSEFLAKMNEGGAAVPGVDYTMIMTRYDELVFPHTSGVLEGADNIVVQDRCALDLSEHGALAFDPVTAGLVLNALDPGDARPPRCTPLLGSPPR